MAKRQLSVAEVDDLFHGLANGAREIQKKAMTDREFGRITVSSWKELVLFLAENNPEEPVAQWLVSQCEDFSLK